MKKLSIEQKTQRYDEILARAKSANIPYYKEDIMSKVKEFVDYLLSELKESKDEPKFKVGDIITNGRIIGKVDENKNNKYHGWFGYDKDLSVHYADIPDVENWHLWTIEDAKDGDVLCAKSGWTCIFKSLDNQTNTFSSYCFMDSYKWFCNTGSEGHTLDEAFIKAYNGEINPATKEQRDLLFQKMKEAGYEWDAEHKKLNKIKQNAPWSEEDEAIIDYLLQLINNSHKEPCTKGLIAFGAEAWLKSLKDRICYVVNCTTTKEWSKEDEKGLCDALWAIQKARTIAKDENDMGNLWYAEHFLNSIKGRVQPQPKQEWSEQDEQYLLVCKNALAKYQVSDKWDATIIGGWLEDKLKSLRPLSQWKPSEEQMNAVLDAIDYLGCTKTVRKYLMSLYEQLKKLREE